jgi:predicted metal-dependent enzyme (double-stranded beta helix superfamily)
MLEVVARAVSDPVALTKAIGESGAAGVNALHTADDLTVLNVVWAEKQITLPHNHGMSAAIGMHTGREDNIFWRRTPGAPNGPTAVAGGKALRTREATLPGADIVHPVINPLAQFSGAIHVCDGPFLTVERSMWDSESLAEKPYDFAAVASGTQLRK